MLLSCGLGAKARFLLAAIPASRLTEILRVEDLPDFNFGAAVEPARASSTRSPHPAIRLDQPEAGDQIAGCADGPESRCAPCRNI